MKQFSKDLGNVSLAPKGRWSKEQEYERLNLVYNTCDNLSYVAKIDVPIGVDIENREYWQPMNATGYADNNFINLTTENENGTITAYETLEEAVATILPINRRAGATLSFYNLNADRLDRQAEFELWQFNSTDLANWETRDYWNNIYYNWNVFAGWYVGADALKNHVKIPNVGQYAYVGSNLNDAILYQCRTNGTWTNTGTKVRNYISVVVGGNITIGENGNWFSDGEDTGIPATPAVDEQLDNIIIQLQQHATEIDELQKQDVVLKSNIDSNFETINNKVDNIKTATDNKIDTADANLQNQITSNDTDIATLNTKHESLSRTVQGIAATGGASTATNVTYNNDSSGLNAENAQDAIDEVDKKFTELNNEINSGESLLSMIQPTENHNGGFYTKDGVLVMDYQLYTVGGSYNMVDKIGKKISVFLRTESSAFIVIMKGSVVYKTYQSNTSPLCFIVENGMTELRALGYSWSEDNKTGVWMSTFSDINQFANKEEFTATKERLISTEQIVNKNKLELSGQALIMPLSNYQDIINNPIESGYWMNNIYQDIIRNQELIGIFINISEIGKLSVYKGTNIGKSNFQKTLVKEFDIDKTGWQMLLFDTPIILGSNEYLGLTNSEDTARFKISYIRQNDKDYSILFSRNIPSSSWTELSDTDLSIYVVKKESTKDKTEVVKLEDRIDKIETKVEKGITIEEDVLIEATEDKSGQGYFNSSGEFVKMPIDSIYGGVYDLASLKNETLEVFLGAEQDAHIVIVDSNGGVIKRYQSLDTPLRFTVTNNMSKLKALGYAINGKVGVYKIANTDILEYFSPFAEKYKKYKGGNFVLFGDSIGAGYNSTKKWCDILSKTLSMNMYNYAVSGSQTSGMLSKIDEAIGKAELVIMAGGTNDWALGNIPLGEMYSSQGGELVPNKDTSTFYGRINSCCEKLLSKYPKSKIILLTPIHRKTFQNQYASDRVPNNKGLYLYQYVDVILESCGFYSIPVINMYADSGLNPNIEAVANAYFNHTDSEKPDLLHPDANGHIRYAEFLLSQIL